MLSPLSSESPPIQSCLRYFASLDGLMSKVQSRRIFHGRGGCYPGWEGLVIDSFHPLLLVTLFDDTPTGFDETLMDAIVGEAQRSGFTSILVQRRHMKGSPIACIWGEKPTSGFAIRGEQLYGLNFEQQNVGFFLDMEPGRQWLESRTEGKRVLNLFSYTCAFSVVAAAAGAQSVLNVDMSSRALSIGRENHRVNNLASADIRYQALDILKSWGRIRKAGPYDLIVVDPPSNQKGSFKAERDYIKVVRRLDELSAPGAQALLCLNAPHLGPQFLLDIVAEAAPNWRYVERLANSPDFPDVSEEGSLKVMVFERR
ncbi:class I SAM-dependent methyltransferase [Aurantivibrio plasticivorans]